MSKNIMPMFGNVARRIIIEIDEKGLQKVVSKDYMVATGTTPENMVMLALPQPRDTDTRMLVMSLIQTINIHLTAIFQAMQVGGSNGKTAT
jgi:triacylglycerol esterase/lipase EstA (alpha/beta hydrolase family)